jgi:hypothetical protein
MGFTFNIALSAGGLFVGMVVLLEVGRRLGMRRLERDSEAARPPAAWRPKSTPL